MQQDSLFVSKTVPGSRADAVGTALYLCGARGDEVEPGSIVAGAARAAAWLPVSSGTRNTRTSRSVKKLREIEHVFDCPPLPREMRRFIDWVARYTLSAPGMVARMVLRVPAAFDPESPTPGLRRTDTLPERMTAARERVLETATGCLGWTRSGLAHAAGVSLSVVDGLTKAGVSRKSNCRRHRSSRRRTRLTGADLSGDQRAAAEALRARSRRAVFRRRCSRA
jgi:primosomal protein N'